jgi:hypothetical protein
MGCGSYSGQHVGLYYGADPSGKGRIPPYVHKNYGDLYEVIIKKDDKHFVIATCIYEEDAYSVLKPYQHA